MDRRTLLSSLVGMPLLAKHSIRVMAWSERSEPSEIYPDGIDGALARTDRSGPALDAVTRAHLDETRARITAALEAGMQRQLPQPPPRQG